MQVNNQEKIAFFLTGRRSGTDLRPMDNTFRPALFAGRSDLTSLRYDIPLILNLDKRPDRAVLSLSRLVDDAIASMAGDPIRDRVARHAYSIERELRRELLKKGSGDFSKIWHTVIETISQSDSDLADSAARLWKQFDASGTILDADAEFTSRVIYHAWNAVQESKAVTFRQKARRLLLKLHEILDAEIVGSASGRSPERLRAGVGASFAGAFDFGEMSRILVESKPGCALSDQRRERIRRLIEVLETQRFYPIGDQAPEAYSFSYFRCSDALDAYRTRHTEAVELLKTLAIADLETKGEYRETQHNVLFESFGANGLAANELAQLPDYFVSTDVSSLDAAETAQLIDLLTAGLPIKIFVRTDDILEPSIVAEGHAALGHRSKQLVNTAIAFTDVFVFQTCASHMYQMREQMLRGLTFDGPAVFSVFSGATGHNNYLPPYLVAAAAMESRAFPALVFDPSAVSDWASRLSVDENPSREDDWPVHELLYQDEMLQAHSEKLAFTLADLMVMDDRFHGHFAIVDSANRSEGLVSVVEAIAADHSGMPSSVPCVTLIGTDDVIRRALIDDRMIAESRRCLSMWRSMQELGGTHNSNALRMMAEELREHPVEPAAKIQAIETQPADAATISEAVASVVSSIAETAAEDHGEEPYIETARCTTCNECTNVNPRMFAYNAEKQAYIADPDAGTFRQLVEAAEGCQVSIIHPGKPRNPKEPGLEDLILRAAEFS